MPHVEKSSCCKASLVLAKSDEVTGYWMCAKCCNPCDMFASMTSNSLLYTYKKHICDELEKQKTSVGDWNAAIDVAKYIVMKS